MVKTRLNALLAPIPSPFFDPLMRWWTKGTRARILSLRSDDLVGGSEADLREQSLKEFREQIIALVKGKIADSTLSQYDASLRALVRIVGDRPLFSLRPYHFELFTARRLEEVSPVRVNIEFRALRALFGRAALYGILQSNLMSRLNFSAPRTYRGHRSECRHIRPPRPGRMP